MDNRITIEEVEEMFPTEIPLVIMKLLFPENSQPMTADEIRELMLGYWLMKETK